MTYRKNRVRDPGFEGTAARWAPSMADLVLLPGTSPAGGSRVARLIQSALGVHGGEGREVRRNLLPNPSFESMSLSSWGVGVGTLARDASQRVVGTASLRVTDTYTTGANSVNPYPTAPVPVEAGLPYAISGHVRPDEGPRSFSVRGVWADEDHAQVGTVAGPFVACPAGAWTRVGHVATAPPGAAFLEFNSFPGPILYATDDPGGDADDYWFDAFMVEQASAVGAYFDGSTAAPPGYHNEWSDGVSNDSASVQRLNEAVLTYTDDDPKTYRADRDETHAFSAYVRSVARQARARVRWLSAYTGAETLRATSGPFATVPGAWVRVSVAYPAPGFLTALLDVVVEGMPLGESHDVDGALYERAPGPLPYFDGDTPSAPFLTYGPGQLASGLAHAWLTQAGARAPHDACSVQVDALGFDLATYTDRVANGGWAAVMDGIKATYFE